MSAEQLSDERRALALRAAAVFYALGATRVWLFGSLAAERSQDQRSDLDLAVEGLRRFELEGAVAEAESLAGCHVDVVDPAAISPALRASVMRTRVLLSRQPVGADTAAASARWYSAPAPDLPRRLFLRRLDAVLDVIRASGAHRVIDLGCGAGWLVELLAREPHIELAAGIDLSAESLEIARLRIARTVSAERRARVQLHLGILTRRDPRFTGFDAATACEVIEHMDPPRLRAFEQVLFHHVNAPLLIVTTPNRDYNAKWHLGRRLRHSDHRFEFTRAELREWAAVHATEAGYDVELVAVGPADADLGSPTQMAVFRRR